VWSELGLKTLLAHLTFTQYLFPITSSDYAINGSLWTLTMEAIFYVVLPGAVLLFRRDRWLVALPAALLANLTWLYLCRHSLDSWVSYLQGTVARFGVDEATIRYFLSKQFPAHLADFALGITLANLVVRKRLTWRPTRLFSALTSALAGHVYFVTGAAWVVVAMNGLYLGWAHTWYLSEMAFGFGFTLLLAGLVFGGRVARAGFETWPLRLVGLVGFSAYLWHLPLICLVLKYPEVSILEPLPRFKSVLGYSLSLLAAVSVFFYLAIERPFLVRGRRARGASVTAVPATLP
jgi:peptidoglycan/LPS O-acetylase OafA/YrhL